MKSGRFLAICGVFGLVVSVGCDEVAVGSLGAVQAPIIGGTAVQDGSWPAVGAITLSPDSMCSGTLIAPNIVVTAAHCVNDPGYVPTKFTLGYDMDNGTDYEVSQYFENPDYDAGGWDDPGSGDVGILVLKENVPGVTPMELFTGDFTQFDGDDIIFVGYGKRSVNQQLYGLKYQVTLTIQDIDANGFWNYTTSTDPHNTCGGDSGGPGFVLSGGKYVIGGFVSSGDQYCVEDGYNMRADANATWLLDMVEQYGGGVVGPVCGNGDCEDGETLENCLKDCSAGTEVWGECADDYTCTGDMFCLQVGQTEFRCTVACDDLELGGGCPLQSMACHELEDGSGACIDIGLVCGDGQCQYGETAESCATDCDIECGDLTFEGCCDGTRAVYCDNGQYRAVECAPDAVCGWVADGQYYFCTEGAATADPSGELPMSCESFNFQQCGDGDCTGTETSETCADDCGAVDYCGNDACDHGETTATCPEDCPVVDDCGNDVCDDDETTATCPEDCPVVDDCGNDVCDDDETTATCPEDCPVVDDCGNDKCDNDETSATCPEDCPVIPPDCGDETCAVGEDCRNCPADCGECPVGDDVIEGDDGVQDTVEPGDATQAGDDGEVRHSGGCSAGGGTASAPLFIMLVPLAAVLFARRRNGARA